MSASKSKQVLWMLAGYVILIGPCLRQDWVPATSTINPFGRAPRPITLWRSAWLNSIYGNREDGVSGAEALIWGSGAQEGKRVPYMPDANRPKWLPWWLYAALRAWLWSAWRNSANELSR